MKQPMRLGITAIVVVAALAVGCGRSAAPTGVETPSPIDTPLATPAATGTAVRVPAVPAGSGTWGPYGGTAVTVGAYFIDLGGLRYTFTVPTPEWWTNDYGSWLAVGKVHGDRVDAPMTRLFILSDDGGEVAADACHWSGPDAVRGTTVDDLVAALAAVDGFESSEPSETTVGGYHEKHLRLTVPADVNMADCDSGEYHFIGDFWDIGQTQDIWVFDADGTRHLFWSVFDGDTPAEGQAELTQLINSLEIEPTTS